MYIDSHCHLNYKGLTEDQAGVIARANASGVCGMLNISTRESEWDDVIKAAEMYPDVWASVGIHPHEADNHPDIDTAKLVAKSNHPRVVALGDVIRIDVAQPALAALADDVGAGAHKQH